MKNLSFITVTFFLVFVSACNEPKYKVHSMIGANEFVDVTDYVNRGYTPVYCDSSIVALKKSDTSMIVQIVKDELLKVLQLMNSFEPYPPPDSFVQKREQKILQTIKYEYTYFILNETPHDVYSLLIGPDSAKRKKFFRISHNHFEGKFSDEGWVTCSSTK